MTKSLFIKMNYSIFGRTQTKQEDIMLETEDKIENLTNEITHVIRTGSVSGDTRLIAKSLLLLSEQIAQLTNVIANLK